MTRPLHVQAFLKTGIVLALYPFNTDQGIEVQRAPDDSGDPDLANLVVIALVDPGVEVYADLLPIDGVNRHYRSRHRVGNATSGWTGWTVATPTTIPDPLPAIQSLLPKLEVVQTVSGTSVSFVVTAQLGELDFGIVEFQDPARSFTATGSMNNGDKTLTVTDGDFTDEDVNLYVSVEDAGVAGILLETRIDSVTSPTEVELETAASGNVANKDVILGGGWFSDFDFDGNDESQETNTRNRPETGRDTTQIMFRAVVNGQNSGPQTFLITPQVAPALFSLVLTVVDDNGGTGDDQYTFTTTVSGSVTDAYSIFFEGGKEGDDTVLVSGSNNSPASVPAVQLDDVGEADGNAVPHHWGNAQLKDAGGDPIGARLEHNDVTPTLA